MDKKHLWKCPVCERRFINKNQEHSCETVDPGLHLHNKTEAVRDICNQLITWAISCNDVRVDAVKNAILIRRNSTFMALKPCKSHVNLEFVLNDIHDEFPVYKTIKASSKKYAHFIRLEHPEEIDLQLLKWLEEARRIS